MKTAAIILALNLHSSTRAADECDPNIMISNAEMKKNDWQSFHGILAAVDTRAGAITVKAGSKQSTIYATSDTIVCNRAKRGKLKDAKIGDTIGGIAKLTSGKLMAVRVGIGGASEMLPNGIPINGRNDMVESPYAKGKYVTIRGRKRGDVIRDPYTQKLFLVP